MLCHCIFVLNCNFHANLKFKIFKEFFFLLFSAFDYKKKFTEINFRIGTVIESISNNGLSSTAILFDPNWTVTSDLNHLFFNIIIFIIFIIIQDKEQIN